MALGFYFMKINKNKNKIIIVLILALISLGIFCYSKTLEKEIENEVKLELREYFEVPIVTKLKETSKEVADSDIVKQRETVSIIVLDKTYQIEIKENETAYLAMKRLEESGNGFSFGGKNYPSLGFFVDEINGVKIAPRDISQKVFQKLSVNEPDIKDMSYLYVLGKGYKDGRYTKKIRRKDDFNYYGSFDKRGYVTKTFS